VFGGGFDGQVLVCVCLESLVESYWSLLFASLYGEECELQQVAGWRDWFKVAFVLQQRQFRAGMFVLRMQIS